MRRLTVYLSLVLLVVLLAAVVGQAPAQAETPTVQPLALPDLEDTIAPMSNLPVDTATYLGGANNDDVSALDIGLDGGVVLAGTMPGHNPGGATPTKLLGGGAGVVARFNTTGTDVVSLTRIGSSINDMEIDGSGRIIVCGDFGMAALSADASSVAWSADPGEGSRCSAGTDDTAAVLVGKSVYVYDSGGSSLGNWTIDSTDVSDIAVDGSNQRVIATGYTQKTGDLQVAFLRAWSYDGAFDWKSYDFSASEASGKGADTRGQRVAIGRDGLLYFAGSTSGGTGASIYALDPLDSTRSAGDRTVKTDSYNNPTNIGDKKIIWYGRFNPNTGALILGQTILTRLSSGGGNSIGTNAIMADEAGRVFIAGSSFATLKNRDTRQVNGTTVGDYEGGEPFFLAVQPDFQQRIVWSPFAAPGTSAGGSPASAVAVRDGLATVGINLDREEKASRALITTGNALQAAPDAKQDGYLAVWRYAAGGAISVDAGEDQTVPYGARVTLQGTGSGPVESYIWAQVGGSPSVTLATPNAPTTTFTAPSQNATLTFELTGAAAPDRSTTDTVQIVVQPIVANAGPDQMVSPADTVQFTLSSQSLSELPIISYKWEQTGGPTDVVTLGPTDQATLDVTIDLQGLATSPNMANFTTSAIPDFEFQLTVTNSEGSDSDTVVVRIREAIYIPYIRR